jgi:endonuclease/exonuclease/phosphatase family metal-dependent hydrolase
MKKALLADLERAPPQAQRMMSEPLKLDAYRKRISATGEPKPPRPPSRLEKIVSWNLLRSSGAGLKEVVDLIAAERPDLLLMQEVTPGFQAICDTVGGYFVRTAMPGRVHGLAVWSPAPLDAKPTVASLPRGALYERICQVAQLRGIAVANVHLSHGQVLNRRQLRRIAELLPDRAAIFGDFNIVGPHLVPSFRDVGPRSPTHRMGDLVPLRLDRCLVRGLVCRDARVLPPQSSDHHPVVVKLGIDQAAQRPAVIGMEARAEFRRRASA